MHRLKHILELLAIVIETIVEARHRDDLEEIYAALYEWRLQKLLLGHADAVVHDDLRHIHLFENIAADGLLELRQAGRQALHAVVHL